MSRRNVMDPEIARDEISSVRVDDSVILDSYDEDMGEPTNHSNEEDDPALLFAILEESLPRQVEAGLHWTALELQQRRDQTAQTWDRVRRWMWTHSSLEERRVAAFVRGQADATALHLMCKIHNPPEDVISALIEAAPEAATWVDTHGWIPLHHACANGASPEVMQILIDAYPAGKLLQDTQERTPLHFYATRNSDNVNTMAINAELLADSGAAERTDRNGMLPMHYASAYGTDPAVLEVLTEAYPQSLTAKEIKGRTPMHLAMVNAHRDTSPAVIRFLLSRPDAKKTINVRDCDGYLPIHLLALAMRGYRTEDSQLQSNVSECLRMYLAAEPHVAADFLTAIQDLPDWLRDTAVVSKHVRNILNKKIVHPFPASILMLDGYMMIILIVCFGLASSNHIDIRFDPTTRNTTQSEIVLLFIGATYFLLREMIQVASLISLGSFSSWWKDTSNYLDVGVIFLVYYYAILMMSDSLGSDNSSFRTGVAVTQGFLYMEVIIYLKNTYVDFAVFVGGVLYVVKRLTAFMIAVGTILLAFGEMFFFIYTNSDVCDFPNPDCRFAHCTFETSFLKVYTMMMGQINGNQRYWTGPYALVAQILYVAYAFLIVILLTNVLIAIVTDSYEIIQNDRAAIVFWSNRLDFIAEMDAITYGLRKRLGCFRNKKQILSPLEEPISESREMPLSYSDGSGDFLRNTWQQIILLFDANLYDEIDFVEAVVYNIFRVFCIVILIPVWLLFGLVTCGWFWPPQVREFLFIQRETVISRAELERRKLEQLKVIQHDVKALKGDITREMLNDRDEMLRMKTEIETVQSEVVADLHQIKELLTSLLGE